MSVKMFCCEYVNQNGLTVTEQVPAYSESAAIRSIMLKHPLAHDVKIVDPAKIQAVTAKDRNVSHLHQKEAVRAPKDKRIVAMLVGLSVLCVAMFVAVVLLLLRQGNDQEGNAVAQPAATNTVAESRYAIDYKNIVSISTKNSRATGFKLKTRDGVYLYTCFHCITSYDAIKCRDSMDKELRLGSLEMCNERDLVRFELPDETEGLELADKRDMRINLPVIAYGDTLGGGVMTQNKGRLLAVGNRKIEIDAAVLSGNSGGPVLTEEGKVVGVISSGSVDNTVWAKDTRYEKVRKFAERIDNGDWVAISYDEFRENYAFLYDTYVAIAEFREYISRVSELNKEQEAVRPFANDQRYIGSFGYADLIKQIYQARNDMIEAERERIKKWNDTKGLVGTAIQENQYYEVVKRRNSYFRLVNCELPSKLFDFALGELRSIDGRYFGASRECLIKDLETVLIPAVKERVKDAEKIEQESQENYQKDFKKVK